MLEAILRRLSSAKTREIRRAVQTTAQQYQLRWLEKTKRFVGVHRGVVVELSEWEGVATFLFISPTFHFLDETFGNYTGFTKFPEAGIPTTWLKPAVEYSGGTEPVTSTNGFVLSIHPEHFERLGCETFTRLPDVAAEQIAALGAKNCVICRDCDERPATIVAVVGFSLLPLCRDCWVSLQLRALDGGQRE